MTTSKAANELTEAQVRALLARAIEEAGSARKFAKQAGVSAAWLSNIMSDRKTPTGRVLDAIGVRRERQTHYFRIRSQPVRTRSQKRSS